MSWRSGLMFVLVIALVGSVMATSSVPDAEGLLHRFETAVLQQDMSALGGLLTEDFVNTYTASDSTWDIPQPNDKQAFLESFPLLWGKSGSFVFGRDYIVLPGSQGQMWKIENLTWTLTVGEVVSNGRGYLIVREVEKPDPHLVIERWVMELGD